MDREVGPPDPAGRPRGHAEGRARRGRVRDTGHRPAAQEAGVLGSIPGAAGGAGGRGGGGGARRASCLGEGTRRERWPPRASHRQPRRSYCALRSAPGKSRPEPWTEAGVRTAASPALVAAWVGKGDVGDRRRERSWRRRKRGGRWGGGWGTVGGDSAGCTGAFCSWSSPVRVSRSRPAAE